MRVKLLWPVPVVLLILAVGCETEPYKQGRWLYEEYCGNCHMENGSGLAGLIPPLAGADYLARENLRTACIIRYGLEDTIVVNGQTYAQPMAGIGQLNEVEITNIINYINQAWGNDLGYVSLESVKNQLQSCRPSR
jgi:mono/diheme cytochrome c family protein